ncbi:MAG: alpha/beta fold hydrolase [Alphaproteobacteria bacterium]|nr:alpha/beta fold hydrolase [Alphaproteobacteria bacterium]
MRVGQMLSRRSLLLAATAGSASSILLGRASNAREERGDVVIERRYVNCRYGQVHIHIARPLNPAHQTQNPILCFHPSPASGWYYRDLIADLGKDRIAMAVDTPGYGESDRPPSIPEMSGYSGAMADALEAMDYGEGKNYAKVDLLGYHTGCLIAVDLAIERPDLIRRLCLVAVPYYDNAEKQQEMLARQNRAAYTEDGERVFEMWNNSVKRRSEGVTLDQAIKIFQERMRAGDTEWWAYQSVFTYPSVERFPMITQPMALLNPHGVLYDETLDAARDNPGATLIDLPQLDHGVFAVGSNIIAEETRKVLDARM